MMRSHFLLLVPATLAFVGCGTGERKSSASTAKGGPADPELADPFRDVTNQELVRRIRETDYPDRLWFRPEANELIRRGLPVYLEVADMFLDEETRSRWTGRWVIHEITKPHYGYGTRGSGWPSKEAEREWAKEWQRPEMTGTHAETLEQRKVIVENWKRWHAENVERKKKL